MALYRMSFSVATFNVCNLQQANQKMFGEFAWTPVQYQRKVGWLAAQLKDRPATLVAFQEVWSEQALQDVFDTAGLREKYQLVCHSNVSPNTGDGMNVACAVQQGWEIISSEWISAFPQELEWHSEDTRYAMHLAIDKFSRPVLKLRLRGPDARTVTLFNVHLKSRRPISPNNDGYYGAGADDWLDIGKALSGMRRLAEAAVLRVLVNRQLAQSTDAVIVAGDCNDRYPGIVLDTLKGDARFRRGTSNPKNSRNRSGRRADWGLYHLLDLDKNAPDVQTERYITFYGDDEVLALDHLLFSWHFHSRAADSRWHLQGWETSGKHLGGGKPYASDHAMVVAHYSDRMR